MTTIVKRLPFRLAQQRRAFPVCSRHGLIQHRSYAKSTREGTAGGFTSTYHRQVDQEVDGNYKSVIQQNKEYESDDNDTVEYMPPVPVKKAVVKAEAPPDEDVLIINPLAKSKDDEESVDWPNLMTQEALMDAQDVLDIPVSKKYPYGGRIVVRNDDSIFHLDAAERGIDSRKIVPIESDNVDDVAPPTNFLPLSKDAQNRLMRFPMIYRNVYQQTGRGKVMRAYHMIVVGNGDGMLGLGEGKHDDSTISSKQAFSSAVRNMDFVDRFEKRTIWTEVSTKLGATRIILRPRPVGFGLRCNPHIHQVLKACGIKDISAKVWGSRNPINVIKGTLRLLQAGHGPTSMGDGIGGPGRTLFRGSGIRSKNAVERERGRKLIDLRT